MKLIIKLAWRGLWRNKRRTLITISAVAFAALLSIAMRGIQLGTYGENIEWALNLFSGYLQLQHPGYMDNPSLHKSFVYDDDIRARLSSDTRIRGFSPRLYADGLISFGDNSLGAVIFGIDPNIEKQVTRMTDRVLLGKMISSSEAREVVVGYKMLRNLKAHIGDEIVVLTQGYDGALGNMKLRITGTVKTGMQEFDGYAVFIGLETLQELITMEDKVSLVAIALHDIDDVNAVTEDLNSSIDTAAVRALSWTEVMPDFKQSIDLDNISGMFFLAILIVIVAFGILNTVLMSVTERFREFGILLAIGMPRKKLVVIVFFETIFILLIGLLIGNILAYAVNYYFMLNPIEFTGEYATLMEEYGWLPQMKSSVELSSFFNTSLSILGISLLSAIYPLYRVFTLEPLKGLRYT